MMSQSDKELLEMAAKAVGHAIADWVQTYSGVRPNLRDPLEPGRWTWSPLDDDGDALRLAVKLDIDLSFYTDKESKVYAQTKHLLGYGTDGYASYQAHEYHKELYEGSDPYAATRRAIVRAAAAIGDAMA